MSTFFGHEYTDEGVLGIWASVFPFTAIIKQDGSGHWLGEVDYGPYDTVLIRAMGGCDGAPNTEAGVAAMLEEMVLSLVTNLTGLAGPGLATYQASNSSDSYERFFRRSFPGCPLGEAPEPRVGQPVSPEAVLSRYDRLREEHLV